MRRKRSDLTEAESIKTIKELARNMERSIDSSESIDRRGECCDPGTLTMKFLVKTNFVDSAKYHEAFSVLSGRKLPAKTKS